MSHQLNKNQIVPFSKLIEVLQDKKEFGLSNIICSRIFPERWRFIMDYNTFKYQLEDDDAELWKCICILHYNTENYPKRFNQLNKSLIKNEFDKFEKDHDIDSINQLLDKIATNVWVMNDKDLNVLKYSPENESEDYYLVVNEDEKYYPVLYENHLSQFSKYNEQIIKMEKNDRVSIITESKLEEMIKESETPETDDSITIEDINKYKIGKFKLPELQNLAVKNGISIYKQTKTGKLKSKTKKVLYNALKTIASQDQLK